MHAPPYHPLYTLTNWPYPLNCFLDTKVGHIVQTGRICEEYKYMATKTNAYVSSITNLSPTGERSDVGENMETQEAASVSVDDILHKLNTNFDRGLTGVEVERRRQLHDGYNEMRIKDDEPLWRKYIQQVDTTLFCPPHLSLHVDQLVSLKIP